MEYPTVSDYVAAERAAASNLARLSHLQLVTDGDGKPVMRTGRKAVALAMSDPATGHRYALKCFLGERPNWMESNMLDSGDIDMPGLPTLYDSMYLDKELHVVSSTAGNDWYPVMLMDWENTDYRYTYGILTDEDTQLSWTDDCGVEYNDEGTKLLHCHDYELKRYNIRPETTMIDECAFMGCEDLQHITLPQGLATIGDNAFFGCKALQHIALPEGLTYLGNEAFSGCAALQEVVVPSSVDYMGEGVFQDCEQLRRAVLRNAYYAVEGHTFSGCTALQEVVLPKGVERMGNDAFHNCRRLQHVDLPQGLQRIEESAFACCESLQRIVVPSSVTSIGVGAFSGCEALQRIALPEGLKSLGDWALAGCHSLKQVDIPATVERIGRHVLADCQVRVTCRSPHFKVLDGKLYTADMEQLLYTPGEAIQPW